jgi:hypothetical protein
MARQQWWVGWNEWCDSWPPFKDTVMPGHGNFRLKKISSRKLIYWHVYNTCKIPVKLWVWVRFCSVTKIPNPYPYLSIPVTTLSRCYPCHALKLDVADGGLSGSRESRYLRASIGYGWYRRGWSGTCSWGIGIGMELRPEDPEGSPGSVIYGIGGKFCWQVGDLIMLSLYLFLWASIRCLISCVCKSQLRRWLAIVLEWELITLSTEVHTNSDKWVNNNLLDQIYPYANHGGQYHSASAALTQKQ